MIWLTAYTFMIFSSFCFSDENGDRPRPLPVIPELNHASDVYERKESPSWDYDVSKIYSFFYLSVLHSSQKENIDTKYR